MELVKEHKTVETSLYRNGKLESLSISKDVISMPTSPAGIDLTEAGTLPPGVDADDVLYRRITQQDTKGLNSVIRDRALQLAFTLILKNPMARAMLELQNMFVCGDGFKYGFEVESDKISATRKEKIIKQCLDKANRFWKINKMDFRFPKKAFDLSYSGMLVLPSFVNPINGEVRLGFIDPTKIRNVIPSDLNVEEIDRIELKGTVTYNKTLTKNLTVIKTDITNPLQNQRYGLLTGDCFYYSINNVSNQPEGVSDLLSVADWLDELDQLMFSVLEHVRNASIYFDDVTVTGMNETQLKEWARRNPMPKKSARFVHNEKLIRDVKSPNIQGRDFSELVRIYKNLILASKSYPEAWFADGGNANLATAVEQGTPAFKRLKERQQVLVYILQEMLTFVIHCAFDAGNGNKAVDFDLTKEELLSVTPTIFAPDFEAQNLKDMSDALTAIATVMQIAESRKWISQETAGKSMRALFDAVGVDIDEETELQRIDTEKDLEPVPAPVVNNNNNQNNNGGANNENQDKNNNDGKTK